MDEAEIDQTNLLQNWKEFNEKSRLRPKQVRDKKKKYF